MAFCTRCGREVAEGTPACPSCEGTVVPGSLPRASAVLARPGDILAGRYEVREILGSGSYGVVYGVHDLKERGEAALKVLHRDLVGFGGVNRLSREVRLVRDLLCPYLVKIHHLDDVGGCAAVKMEWVKGRSLRQRIRAEGPLPRGEAVRLFRYLLQALEALHACAIVHRDVKSQNILLTEDGTLKLADFGLARNLSLPGSLTRSGAVLGTVGYMAPEVAQGKEATPLSDLYSAGCVLFEMLTGELPYEGDSLDSLWRQAVEAPRLHLLKKRGVPGWLRRITARLLEKNPADRYPSAKAVLEALDARWAGIYLPGRYRRRGALAGAALLAASLLAGGLLWLDGHLPPRVAFAGRTLTVWGPLGNRRYTKTLDLPIQAAHAGRFGPNGNFAVAVVTFWGEQPEAATLSNPDLFGAGNRLLLFSARGEPLFSTRLKLDEPFRGMANRLTVTLDAHRFARGEPERLVLLVHHHLWYPTQIEVLRPSSHFMQMGAGIGFTPFDRFMHTGFLDFPLRYRDLDGDGLDEVVATGVNNLLYRLQVVTAFSVERYLSAELPRRFVAPVQTAGGFSDLQEAPLYWGLDLYRGKPFLLEDPGASQPLRIVTQEGAFRLLPGYRLAGEGNRPLPSPGEIRALNARLKALCALREERRWSSLLEEARRWPEGLPFPYDWMGTFFEAHALEGLGRAREVRPLLADALARRGRGEGPGPYYAYRLLEESAFLSGDYRAGARLWETFPPEAAGLNREAMLAAWWCAVYAGEETTARRIATGEKYPLEEGRIRSFLHAWLSGDEETARELRDRLPLETIQFPEALLYAAAFDAEAGKVGEADRWLGLLKARFAGEDLDGGETEAWVRFRKGQGLPPVAEMEAALLRRRKRALIEPDERALLPVTLARTAAVLRAAGKREEAESRRQEALALAPLAWRRNLDRLGGPPPAAARPVAEK